MCKEILSSYTKKIESDVYSLEFLNNIYGNIQRPLAKALRQIEDQFLKFQNKWFWKKRCEITDAKSFLQTSFALLFKNSMMITNLLEKYEPDKLNVGLISTYKEYLLMAKILDQFADNCKMVIKKEFRDENVNLNFI